MRAMVFNLVLLGAGWIAGVVTADDVPSLELLEYLGSMVEAEAELLGPGDLLSPEPESLPETLVGDPDDVDQEEVGHHES